MKWFTCVILLLLTPTHLQAAEPMFAQGVGTVTCAEFSKVYNEDVETAFYSWAQGFMAGWNFAIQELGGRWRDVAASSTDDQKFFLRQYCDMHPLGSYAQGVLMLYFGLPIGPDK